MGKVGTDLHTATFDPQVARELTAKVRPYGSWIKGHYTDDVSNPEEYPLSGMGAANVGPEFTISEYDALAELETEEKALYDEGKVAKLSNMTDTLNSLVHKSGRWRKWLLADEQGSDLNELSPERFQWIVKTCSRYIWQHPEALAARQSLYENLDRVGIDAEEMLLGRIEHDMDKYYNAFNLIDLNKWL